MPLCPQITNTPITVTYNSTDYILDSVQDVQTTATTFYAAPTPTAQAVGDIWYDTTNGNKQYRWDGSTWTSVQDTAIASAYSLASTANSNATTATATANGKNVVTYSTSSYSGSGTRQGDIWFKYQSGTGVILSQWTWNGSSWDSTTLSDSVIASITAGKITAGTITVALGITNPSGNFTVNATTGKLTASGVDISGTLTSTSGTIGGFTINNGYLSYGSTYLNASSGTGSGSYALYDSSRGVYANTLFSYSGAYFANATSSFDASGNLQINGNTFLNASGSATIGGTLGVGTVNSSGSITVNGGSNYFNSSGNLNAVQGNFSGYIYNSGYATTTSAANAYINSSTGLLARSSSSLRYKVDVEAQTIPIESILALEPKSFFDKGQVEEKGSTDGLPRILGLIAEEVGQIPVLADLLMNKNKEGQPDSVNYDRIAVALIPLLKDLNNRLSKLEGK
jgi:hypothetical protein